MATQDIERRAECLFRRLHDCRWTGPDPYDGLTSPVAALARHAFLRQALLQAVKRSPVDLRPWLAIRSPRTATACGVGATACSRLADTPLWHDRARRLGHWTAQRQLSGTYTGLWGYEFDVQTRWAYYPAFMPNVIATAFCADGCLDTGTLGGAAAEALATALLRHLFTGRHFAYTPTTDKLVHNANLMGAALASRLALLDGMPRPLASRLADAARSAVDVAVAGQRPDGSWPYGAPSNLGWVDGYHTGYVLLRLDAAATGLGIDLGTAIDSGARYYLNHLFDGPVPRYYAAGRHPRDRGQRDPNNDATAVRMAVWAEERGYAPRGFADDVLAQVISRIPGIGGERGQRVSAAMKQPIRQSPRWSLAPFLDALTALCATRGTG